jgi:hypothetical protein
MAEEKSGGGKGSAVADDRFFPPVVSWRYLQGCAPTPASIRPTTLSPQHHRFLMWEYKLEHYQCVGWCVCQSCVTSIIGPRLGSSVRSMT